MCYEDNKRSFEKHRWVRSEFPIGTSVRIKEDVKWEEIKPYAGRVSKITRISTSCNGKVGFILQLLPGRYLNAETDIGKNIDLR